MRMLAELHSWMRSLDEKCSWLDGAFVIIRSRSSSLQLLVGFLTKERHARDATTVKVRANINKI